MGIRKAQVFTIRSSGLRQPITNYGETCALGARLMLVIIARFTFFEVAIRGAIEQIKNVCAHASHP